MLHVEPSYSVLIVDPKEAALPVLKRMLGEIGIVQVESVPNAVDALAKMRETRTSLLMTDWAMEPMGGAELLRAMRADPQLAETPMMVVTTEPAPAQFFDAIDAGVNAYAIAPFTIQTLEAKLAVLQEGR